MIESANPSAIRSKKEITDALLFLSIKKAKSAKQILLFNFSRGWIQNILLP